MRSSAAVVLSVGMGVHISIGVAVAVTFGIVRVGVLVGLIVARIVGISVWVIVLITVGKCDGNNVGVSACEETWHPIEAKASAITKINNLYLSNNCSI
jgi:predicted phosphoribosyltransferase